MSNISVPHIKTITSLKEFKKIFVEAFNSSDFYAGKSWCLGGASGGNCYGGTLVGYPGEEDPDPEMESRVFKIMVAFWPEMTITELSELRNDGFLNLVVDNGCGDYYGNFSSNASMYADFEKFYNFAHR